MGRRNNRPKRRWCRGSNFHKRFRRKTTPRPFSLFTRRNPAYRELKKKVHGRDGRCCQLCGKQQKRYMHLHHIKRKSDHPELGFLATNCISLCKRCHDKLVTGREGMFEHVFELAVEAGIPVPYSVFTWFNEILTSAPPGRLCGCGCGAFTTFHAGKYRRYIQGHFRRSKAAKVVDLDL